MRTWPSLSGPICIFLPAHCQQPPAAAPALWRPDQQPMQAGRTSPAAHSPRQPQSTLAISLPVAAAAPHLGLQVVHSLSCYSMQEVMHKRSAQTSLLWGCYGPALKRGVVCCWKPPVLQTGRPQGGSVRAWPQALYGDAVVHARKSDAARTLAVPALRSHRFLHLEAGFMHSEVAHCPNIWSTGPGILDYYHPTRIGTLVTIY